MSHWLFVLAAYAVAAVVLLGYWWRVERRIRVLETGTEGGLGREPRPRAGR